MSSPGIFRGTLAAPAFEPGTLTSGATYWWRIDEVNAEGTTTGEVWRFTVGPRAACVDFDGDRDVDMVDFAHLQCCLTGTGVFQSDPACADARIDGDLDVDGDELEFFLGCLTGADIAAPPECAGPAGGGPIPTRAAGALTGSAILDPLKDLALAAREARILQELTTGNVPAFLRAFADVPVSAVIEGTTRNGVLRVMPDYLAIGSDADFFRMPMRPGTAQAVADRFECMLPTRRMVDLIYARAPVKLAPAPIQASPDMTLVTTFWQHQLMIEQQRAGGPPGPLIGGIKKDVVVTPQLAARPGKVAIYGWHQLNGTPIQPLYLGHTDTWVDYSHGIRLVSGYMRLDGFTVPVADVLRDPKLCALLSDEGVVENPRY
jgi:hypothetical protein